MTILGTLHQIDESRGRVRVEDVYDTDIEDLWEACTDPERLSRWIADVSGDLREGGSFTGSFTSGFEGAGRVEVCERPSRLVLSEWAHDAPEVVLTVEALLTSVDGGTRLVIEERGVPLADVRSYGAGWQVHAEDLGAHVAGQARDDDPSRWSRAVTAYDDVPVQADA